MNSANWLPALSALVLILTGCTGNKTSFSGGPHGTGPFNSRGDYVDAWADDPSKWSRPGSRQRTDDLPVVAKTEEPPANANPHNCAISDGATLAVTEILPRPPASINSIAVASSPE